MIHSGTSVLCHHLESKGCTSVLNHQLVVAALVKENQRKSGKCSFIKTTGDMENNNKKAEDASSISINIKVSTIQKLMAMEAKVEIWSAENACKDAFAMMAASMNLPLSTFDNPAFHHTLQAVACCVKLGAKTTFGSITVHMQILS